MGPTPHHFPWALTVQGMMTCEAENESSTTDRTDMAGGEKYPALCATFHNGAGVDEYVCICV